MTEIISLRQWALKNGLSYSLAQRYFTEGRIEGSFKKGFYSMVPEDAPAPVRATVECMICRKHLTQITLSHLQSAHGIGFDEYREQFPNALLVSTEIRETIREKNVGKKVSVETGQKISASKKGKRPENHPRYVVGSYSPSEETRAKMIAAHTGKTHTDEIKKKIGDGNRGKVMPREAVERQRASLKRWHTNNPNPNQGRVFDEEVRAKMSASAFRRWENMAEDEYRRTVEAIRRGAIGQVRTPEQRLRYQDARLKFMSENPQRCFNTKGEIFIKEWFEARAIEVVQQFVIPGIPHPYDFYLPAFDLIIEFDGPHHWRGPWFNTKHADGTRKSPEELEAIFDRQQDKDMGEARAAEAEGFTVIRIRAVSVPGDSQHGTLEAQLGSYGLDFGIPATAT